MRSLSDALRLTDLAEIDGEIRARKDLRLDSEVEQLLDRRIAVEFQKVAVVEQVAAEPAIFVGTINHASSGESNVLALKYDDGRTLILKGGFDVTVIKSTIVERKRE